MTHATPTELIARAQTLEHEARWAGVDEGNMRDEARNLRALASEASRYAMASCAGLQPAIPVNDNLEMERAA